MFLFPLDSGASKFILHLFAKCCTIQQVCVGRLATSQDYIIVQWCSWWCIPVFSWIPVSRDLGALDRSASSQVFSLYTLQWPMKKVTCMLCLVLYHLQFLWGVCVWPLCLSHYTALSWQARVIYPFSLLSLDRVGCLPQLYSVGHSAWHQLLSSTVNQLPLRFLMLITLMMWTHWASELAWYVEEPRTLLLFW